jgi:GNAT superfamily N-acetyltransferase
MLEVGGAVCVAVPAIPEVRMVNRAIGVTSRTTESELDEMEAFFADAGVLYQLTPAEPGLDDRLAARGYVPGYAWMKFTRGAEPPRDHGSDLRVERVGRASTPDFARVVRETWGFPDELDAWLAAVPHAPGWTCYVTYDGDVAAGAAALYVHDGAAWFGFGSTLPEFRGRGSQSALFAARITDASAQGVRLLVTETGVAGEDGPGSSYRNILRAGFRETYVRPNYLRP